VGGGRSEYEDSELRRRANNSAGRLAVSRRVFPVGRMRRGPPSACARARALRYRGVPAARGILLFLFFSNQAFTKLEGGIRPCKSDTLGAMIDSETTLSLAARLARKSFRRGGRGGGHQRNETANCRIISALAPLARLVSSG